MVKRCNANLKLCVLIDFITHRKTWYMLKGVDIGVEFPNSFLNIHIKCFTRKYM